MEWIQTWTWTITMSERIKLTEDDIIVDVWQGIIPNNISMIKIYCNEEKHGIETRQQILENQRLRELVEKQANSMSCGCGCHDEGFCPDRDVNAQQLLNKAKGEKK